jgi:hypothetical protein
MDRYDIEIIRADNHEADTRRWVSIAEAIVALRNLQDGDDMIVHHVGYTEPGVIYD